jgi:hypothetical protein
LDVKWKCQTKEKRTRRQEVRIPPPSCRQPFLRSCRPDYMSSPSFSSSVITPIVRSPFRTPHTPTCTDHGLCPSPRRFTPQRTVVSPPLLSILPRRPCNSGVTDCRSSSLFLVRDSARTLDPISPPARTPSSPSFRRLVLSQLVSTFRRIPRC